VVAPLTDHAITLLDPFVTLIRRAQPGCLRRRLSRRFAGPIATVHGDFESSSGSIPRLALFAQLVAIILSFVAIGDDEGDD
jgi:hypothetical protein